MLKIPQTHIINSLLTAPKIPTDLLWGLSAFFGVLALVYLISVFVFRNKISKETRLVREKKKELSPIISEFLFYDEKGDKIEKINYIGLKVEIRELIKDDFDRKVLTEIVMDLRKDVSGTTRQELFHIYKDLELHKDAYKKLKSWRWELVSKGIYELTQMNVTESYGLITRFINDKRGTIRKQAEIATVSLKEDGISYFLDNTKYKISEWQQLKLMDVVRNKENFIPPAFRLWLTSKNNYVVLFSLRLIKYYNQNDSHASLIELVKHKNNHIKREAIQCITAFHITDAIPVLKMVFRKCTTDVKMTILEALGELGSKEEIDFLKQVEITDKDFTVRNKAVRAINTISPEVILPTKDIAEASAWEETVMEEPHVADTGAQAPEVINELPKRSEDTIVPQESNKIESKPPTMEIDPEELSFLPLVTTEQKNQSGLQPEEPQPTINELPVVYDEVAPGESLLELNIDFLPIVQPALKDDENDLLQMEVIFQNVTPTTKIEKLENITVDFDEVEVASGLVSDHVPPAKELPQKTERVDVREFDLIFEEVIIENSEFSTNEMIIDWTTAFEENSIVDATNEVMEIEVMLNAAEIVQNEVQEDINLSIPKPKFLAKQPLETMILLQDIAELGDHREIPFLKLLLEKERSAAVRQRIEELINSFTENRAGNYFKITTIAPGYSIFHELFQNRDVESKLVLLNEVAAVGDEKEIPLLHSLLEDESPIIRKHAAKTLKLLNERLLEEVSNEISELPIDAVIADENVLDSRNTLSTETKTSLLDIPFELEKSGAIPIEKENTNVIRESGSTLFDHLCAVSTKFYNKLNG